MRTVVSPEEVAHLWANKVQDHARNAQGNIYFRGDTIYSYGNHFPMGRHVQGTRNRHAVIITTRTYSPTTNRHTSVVRNAARHLTTFFVPLTDYSDQGPEKWIKSYVERIDEALALAKKARKNKLYHFQQAQSLASDANDFAEFFGIRRRITLPDNLDAAIESARKAKEVADAKNAKALAERRAREEKERAEAREKALATIPDWRAGNIYHIPGLSTLNYDLMRVSLDGRTVETSRGAIVPVSHVRRAIRLLEKLRQSGAQVYYPDSGHSFRIGHYALHSMIGDEVRVGCHTFEWSEVENIGNAIDNIPEALDGPTTIADIPQGLALITDSQDVDQIKQWAGSEAQQFDSFFVGYREGHIIDLWGFMGIVPALDKPATRILHHPGPFRSDVVSSTEGGAL